MGSLKKLKINSLRDQSEELKLEKEKLETSNHDKTREDAVESLRKVKKVLEAMKISGDIITETTTTPHYALSTESRRQHIKSDKEAHQRPVVAITL